MAKVIDAILNLKDNFTATANKATTSMEMMAKQAKRTGKQIEQTGQSLGNVGSTMIKGVTIPLLAAGAASAKFSMDFSDGIAKVSTVADTSQMSIDQIRKSILKLSNVTGVVSNDMTEGLYDVLSAGVDTKNSIKFLEVAVKSAKGGFTDTKTAVDGLTTTLNSYGMAADQAGKIANQMMVAQNLGKTTFGEMASAIGNVTPIANTLGVSTNELFSSMATLTANGIKTTEAITGLKSAYSNIIKPSGEAADMAKNLGLDFSAAHLKSIGWAKFLLEIQQKTGGSTEKMAKLFGSVEGLNSVLALTSKQGIKLYNQSMEQMASKTDFVTDAFNKVSGTPGEKMRKSLNQIKNAAIQFGDVMAPTIAKVAGVITNLADKFANMSPAQREFILKLALTVAAAGPVIKAISTLTTGIGGIVKGFGKFASASKSAGGALSALLSSGNKVVLIITAIGIAIGLVIKFWPQISSFFKKVGEIATNVFNSIKNVVVSVINFLKPIVSSVISALAAAFNVIKKVVTTVFNALKPIIKVFFGLIRANVEIIKGVFKIGFAIIATIVTAVFKVILAVAKPIFNALKAVVLTFIKIVTTTVKTIETAFSAVWNAIKPVVTAVCGFIGDAFKAVGKVISGIWEGVSSVFKGFINIIISGLNFLIGCLNKISFTVPKWVPFIGGKHFGFDIKPIPKLARGTDNWQGGPAIINDGIGGGELVDLPNGSKVIPADKTDKILSQKSSITIAKLADQIIVREEADIDKIATAIVKKIKMAEANFA